MLILLYARGRFASSVDAQLCGLREYARLRGDQVAEFVDSDVVSGSASLDTVLRVCRLRSAGAVVVDRLDRFGVPSARLVEFESELRKEEVHLVSIDPRVDTSTSQGRLVLGSIAYAANMDLALYRPGRRRRFGGPEVEELLRLRSSGLGAGRIASVLGVCEETVTRELKRQGAKTDGRGYLVDPRSGVPQLKHRRVYGDPGELYSLDDSSVKEVLRLRSSGLGYKRIARVMGVSPWTVRDELKRQSKRAAAK